MTKTMFILGSLASLAACGSMADPSYQGESMAKLTGTVRSQLGEVPSDVTAAIVWATAPFDETASPTTPFLLSQASYGTAVDVDGTFPSTFTLNVYEPPPDIAMSPDISTDPDHPLHIAMGRVFAVDPARVTANDDGTENVRDAILGSSDQLVGDGFGTAQYFLYYYDADMPDDDATFPGLKKGYHLQRFDGDLTCATTLDSISVDDCIAAWGSDPDNANEVAEARAFCTTPIVAVKGYEDIDLATPLTITLAAPEYITLDFFAGVYPSNHLPDCPQQ